MLLRNLGLLTILAATGVAPAATRLTFDSGVTDSPVVSPVYEAASDGTYLITGEAFITPPFGDELIGASIRVDGQTVENSQLRTTSQGQISYSLVTPLAAGSTVDVVLIPGGFSGDLQVFEADLNVIEIPQTTGNVATRLTFDSGVTDSPVSSPVFEATADGTYLITGEAFITPPFGDELIGASVRVDGQTVGEFAAEDDQPGAD